MRTPGTVSHAVPADKGGAQQHRRGRGNPLPPEADENTESTMVVGWLMRPDVVPVGTQLEQTTVQLWKVTGELDPMLGKGRMTLNVGGLSVDFTVWVAQLLHTGAGPFEGCALSAGPGEEHIDLSRGPHC